MYTAVVRILDNQYCEQEGEIKVSTFNDDHLECNGVSGVDDAALYLVWGQTELLQPRVIEQLAGADVDGALSSL